MWDLVNHAREEPGIVRAAGADFHTLDIAVIDVPVLRLDHRSDRQRLEQTVPCIRPRLVLLDPLVHLYGVDENAVAEIAPILGFLRELQRRFEAAVVLVHHARKSGAAKPGQALRGNSELHAWGDSNLYLRRRDNQIVMTAEHRAAPGLNDVESEEGDGFTATGDLSLDLPSRLERAFGCERTGVASGPERGGWRASR